MQDILSMDIEKELPVLDSTGEDPVINDEEIKEIKLSGGEDGEVYKQINVISNSDGVNNNSSTKNFDLNDYIITNLWTKSDSSAQSAFNFSKTWNVDTEKGLYRFRYSKNNTDTTYFDIYVSSEDINKSYGNAPKYNIALSNNSGGSTHTYRRINALESRNVVVDQLVSKTLYCEVSASTGNNNQNVLVSVDYLEPKASTVTPDPTPTPTPTPDPVVSGNTINNYYTYYNTYTSVSDNSLSYNILNKPLNEYTVSEGYLAFGTMIFLCVGIYLIIRRSIFKWR